MVFLFEKLKHKNLIAKPSFKSILEQVDQRSRFFSQVLYSSFYFYVENAVPNLPTGFIFQLVQPEPGPSGTSGWADSPGTNQDRPPLPRSLPVLKDSQGEPVPVKGNETNSCSYSPF